MCRPSEPNPFCVHQPKYLDCHVTTQNNFFFLPENWALNVFEPFRGRYVFLNFLKKKEEKEKEPTIFEVKNMETGKKKREELSR